MMNAANEIAVAAYLRDAIGFNDIYRIVEQTIVHLPNVARPTYDDYVTCNNEARAYAMSLL